MEILTHVPAHHVDAERQRQARVPLPFFAQIENLRQPHRLVGNLAFVNQ